jgi:hypothetical protein
VTSNILILKRFLSFHEIKQALEFNLSHSRPWHLISSCCTRWRRTGGAVATSGVQPRSGIIDEKFVFLTISKVSCLCCVQNTNTAMGSTAFGRKDSTPLLVTELTNKWVANEFLQMSCKWAANELQMSCKWVANANFVLIFVIQSKEAFSIAVQSKSDFQCEFYFFKFAIIIHLYARLSIWSYEKKEAVGVQPLFLFTKQKKG